MHVYAHLFRGLEAVPYLRSPRQEAQRLQDVPLNLLPSLVFEEETIRRAPQLRSTRTCPATVSYHVDHTHRLLILRDTIFNPPPVVGSGLYAATVNTPYRTTFDNNHSHVVALTSTEYQSLRAGQTITKKTSSDARPGGQRHSHTVTISCVEGGLFKLTPPY